MSDSTPTMTLDEARDLLNQCKRTKIVDRDTGAYEAYWHLEGQEIAGGWFGGGVYPDSVWFTDTGYTFTGDDARLLRYCAAVVRTEFLQPSEVEQEAASLARLARLASPYNPATGGGLIIG